MGKHEKYPILFKTKVLGLGPFCVEFGPEWNATGGRRLEGGEIIQTRSEKLQKLLAAAPIGAKLAAAVLAREAWERTGEDERGDVPGWAEIVTLAREFEAGGE